MSSCSLCQPFFNKAIKKNTVQIFCSSRFALYRDIFFFLHATKAGYKMTPTGSPKAFSKKNHSRDSLNCNEISTLSQFNYSFPMWPQDCDPEDEFWSDVINSNRSLGHGGTRKVHHISTYHHGSLCKITKI